MARHEKFTASAVLASKFGKLTGFVHSLATRLQEAEERLGVVRRVNQKLHDLLGRKRTAVLVRVEGSGDVSIYGRNVEVEIVEIPTGIAGPRAMNLVEVWADAGLPERFRELHLPSLCVATVNARACRTVTEVYEASQMAANIEAISNLKGKRSNAPTKDPDTRTTRTKRGA